MRHVPDDMGSEEVRILVLKALRGVEGGRCGHRGCTIPPRHSAASQQKKKENKSKGTMPNDLNATSCYWNWLCGAFSLRAPILAVKCVQKGDLETLMKAAVDCLRNAGEMLIEKCKPAKGLPSG